MSDPIAELPPELRELLDAEADVPPLEATRAARILEGVEARVVGGGAGGGPSPGGRLHRLGTSLAALAASGVAGFALGVLTYALFDRVSGSDTAHAPAPSIASIPTAPASEQPVSPESLPSSGALEPAGVIVARSEAPTLPSAPIGESAPGPLRSRRPPATAASIAPSTVELPSAPPSEIATPQAPQAALPPGPEAELAPARSPLLEAELAPRPRVAEAELAPSPRAARAPSPTDDLAAERALLEVVRAAVARDHPDVALDAIRRHERDFPRGELTEEREGLRVIALVRAGHRDEARARADRFRARWPRSVLLRAIDAVLTPR